ncbi:M48 family metallopeptidase [Brevundimonas sp. 374]|uniref:tetratricopeptide repeat protein n=1 Tax=Brevundimonas sp. 374 TaxID=1150400 RepID=UPI00088AB56F|nr:hypothetical protein [Brevundimonas sp. 374]SDR05937.1 hypothetical protein SAMN02787020_2550 [Brevundimonas sp. 374]
MPSETSPKSLDVLRVEAEEMSRILHSEPRQWGPFYASYADAMVALGWHDRALRELEAAAVSLEQVERGSPIHITALYRKAVIEHGLGDRLSLVETLKRLLLADPSALPLVRPLLSDALANRLERELDASSAGAARCASALAALLRGARESLVECDPLSVVEAVSSYVFMKIEELSPAQVNYLTGRGIHEEFLTKVFANRAGLTNFVSPPTNGTPWRSDPGVSPRIRDVLDAIQDGAKSTISPWSAQAVRSRKMLGSEVFLFREEHDPFIVAQWTETDRVTADTFWILPSISTVLYYGESNIRDLDARNRISMLYVDLLGDQQKTLLYLSIDATEVIVAQHPIPHIGHYVWNGVSGWDAFFKYCPRDRRPDAIAYSGNLRMMGDVTEIYPEFCSQIREIVVCDDEAQLAALPRARNAIVLTLKDDFVTEGLARRMLSWAGDNVSEEFQAEIADFRSRCYPVILVNVRLDNRAWIEQAEGFAELFKALRLVHPAIGFIIDGINSGVTQGWTHADMSVDRERQLARSLINSTDDVMIYDSIGCTVAESLVIAEMADGFIGHVGAGMAKYRWVANLPGVAFSNETFSTPGHRDGQLYDSYREGARKAIHVPQSAVRDDRSPGAPVGTKANFSMNWQSVYEAALELIRTLRS